MANFSIKLYKIKVVILIKKTYKNLNVEGLELAPQTNQLSHTVSKEARGQIPLRSNFCTFP